MLLSVGSATPVGSVAHFENSTGSCYINPTTTSLSCSSDARLKTNISTVSASSGLDALLQLNPVTFNWVHEATGTPMHSGFIAQDVQKVLPDLISQGPDGYYTMNYAGLVTYIVKAIQQLAAQLSDLAATVASFADHFTTKELTFTRATGDEMDLKKLCLEDVCVTKSQLAAVLSLVGQYSASAPSSSTSSSPSAAAASDNATTTPPVIAIAGNNPAHITVGESYQDLGATAKDSQGHDLGIKTFLNGSMVSPQAAIQIDTSTTTTDTIDYVATDTNGLTSTSTRTVIIEPAPQSLPITDSPPLVPTTDTATSTAATTSQ